MPDKKSKGLRSDVEKLIGDARKLRETSDRVIERAEKLKKSIVKPDKPAGGK